MHIMKNRQTLLENFDTLNEKYDKSLNGTNKLIDNPLTCQAGLKQASFLLGQTNDKRYPYFRSYVIEDLMFQLCSELVSRKNEIPLSRLFEIADNSYYLVDSLITSLAFSRSIEESVCCNGNCKSIQEIRTQIKRRVIVEVYRTMMHCLKYEEDVEQLNKLWQEFLFWKDCGVIDLLDVPEPPEKSYCMLEGSPRFLEIDVVLHNNGALYLCSKIYGEDGEVLVKTIDQTRIFEYARIFNISFPEKFSSPHKFSAVLTKSQMKKLMKL